MAHYQLSELGTFKSHLIVYDLKNPLVSILGFISYKETI